MKTMSHFVLVVALLAALLMGCAPNRPAAMPAAAAESTPLPPTVASEPAPTSETRALTPIDKLGRTGTAIEVDIKSYRLLVDGLVERPLSLSYDELLAYPAVSQMLRLECPGFFVDYAEWTGPLVRTLLEQAGVKPEAKEVEFAAGDKPPYQKTLTLEEALQDNSLLAYKVNGETLPVEHGYPVRLAVGSKLGSYWVKWLFRIEVK